MADARCPSSPSHPAESSRVFESIRIDNFSHHDFPTNSLNPFLDEVSTRSGSDGAPRHCRLPTADCRLPITNFLWRILNWQSQIGNRQWIDPVASSTPREVLAPGPLPGTDFR